MGRRKQPLAFGLGEVREREHIEQGLAFANADSELTLRARAAFLWNSMRPHKELIFQTFFTERNLEHLAKNNPAAHRATMKKLWGIRDMFRDRIAAIATDIGAARRDLETDLNVDLQRVRRHAFLQEGVLRESIVEIGENKQADELRSDKSWERVGRPFAGGLAYVAALLLDSQRKFGSELRRCKLKECGNYFLSISRRGGPRPKYCSLEHTKEADNQRAAARMAENRAGQKARRHK